MRPKNPQHLALKIAFIGYAFAGKKTQASQIAEQYGLQTFQMSDLVGEALSFYESNPEPIVKSIHEEKEEQPEIEDLSENSELENEDFNAEEDFRLCGQNIANLLSEG